MSDYVALWWTLVWFVNWHVDYVHVALSWTLVWFIIWDVDYVHVALWYSLLWLFPGLFFFYGSGFFDGPGW